MQNFYKMQVKDQDKDIRRSVLSVKATNRRKINNENGKHPLTKKKQDNNSKRGIVLW